jgi:DNA (cytosine-5)-methyltransferase 1
VSARPRLLDLFCGAGGCSVGYYRAGFDVTGVDLEPQPNYPFTFVQADALEYLATADLSPFAAIHASPVCKRYSATTPGWARERHPDQITPVRELLKVTGLPWVIENVPRAPVRPDLKLCGCMFGLPNLKRERWFETSWHALELRPPCHHPEPIMSVTGTGFGTRLEYRNFGRWPKKADWQRAMGIDWMTPDEMAQAIPPAYTEHIGRMLLDVLTAGAGAA